ncbi:MAG: serine/threonine protein kinase, partial [Symploca sp. SIO1B1]|nr:serine/threonine protein kinase [Symploca sp. SIO1B1]
MLTIPGYNNLTLIYESTNSEVYQALREQDSKSVILKILKQNYPSPQELTRYKQEYELTRYLQSDGVVETYDLIPYQRTLVIVLEDFGGQSLHNLTHGKALAIAEFLPIAIKITKVLGEIHHHQIIHKDINLANIVFNPETQQLKIIDFGIATQLTRENPTLKNPNVLEGTLPYISPEQTGRMNRSLDYRTDFYSLGVSFYKLLTGQLPFITNDALELVHCHIAKMPPLLGGRRNPPLTPPKRGTGIHSQLLFPGGTHPQPLPGGEEIPEMVGNIVMKLMAKNAENRYQSAWGIQADLENCLQQLQTNGKIEQFPLATQDISDKFQIPQKLYGREGEIATLLAAFNRITSEQQAT